MNVFGWMGQERGCCNTSYGVPHVSGSEQISTQAGAHARGKIAQQVVRAACEACQGGAYNAGGQDDGIFESWWPDVAGT